MYHYYHHRQTNYDNKDKNNSSYSYLPSSSSLGDNNDTSAGSLASPLGREGGPGRARGGGRCVDATMITSGRTLFVGQHCHLINLPCVAPRHPTASYFLLRNSMLASLARSAADGSLRPTANI